MKTNIKRSGFTLIEIMIVIAIICLLAAIAIPAFVHARSEAQMNACISNLRLIDGAKQEWKLATKADPAATPTSGQVAPYMTRIGRTDPVVCPLDSRETFETSYSIGNLATAPACLIAATNTQDNSLNHMLKPLVQ